MKVGQLIDIKIFFFKNHVEKWGSSRAIFFLKKALYEVKESGLQLSFNMSW